MAEEILKTSHSRVFLTMSQSSPAVQPEYQSCMILGGISQSFGDREAIYCQDPYRIGRFKTVGYTESPAEPVETSLDQRYPLDGRSPLVRAAKAQAKVDLHVHMGAFGANPSIFNTWRKKIIFEGARISSLDIDEVGSHDEDTNVNHTVDITADEWYEIVPLIFTQRNATSLSTPIVGTYLFYNGRTELPPRERVIALAVNSALSGSPPTRPDLLYSLDHGTNWYETPIVSISSTSVTAPLAGVVVIGEYVVVASSLAATHGLHYVRWDGLTTVSAPTWSQVTTGFDNTKLAQAMCSIGSVGFIAATGGYVYKVTDAPSGARVMSAGSATVENLLCVAALDENVVIAGGESNAVIICTDGENFAAVTGPAVAADITAVAALGPNVFLAGTSTGRLFYTTNSGVSWTEKAFPGSGGSGMSVKAISFPTKMIGYMSTASATSANIFMTTDGGYSWEATPSGGVLSYTNGFRSLATMRDDPNVVLAGGPSSSGTADSLLMGEPVS